MSPENARLIIMEDNKYHLRNYRGFVEANGHHVVGTAMSVPEGMQLIEGLKGQKVDVALIDGNLGTSRHGEDGERLALHARKSIPQITVIAISADRQLWSDNPNITKDSDSQKLLEAIKEA